METSPSTPPLGSRVGPAESGFLLLIERGTSRFPQRPINTGRFLIGAGSNCHLQLGGDIPLLHSIIVPEDNHLWIDAVAPSPPLVVNGHLMRDGEINRGDIIEIGEFVFCVDYRVPAAQSRVEIPELNTASERSAAELLEMLEADVTALNQFENGRKQGAAALQDAVSRQLNVPQQQWNEDPRAAMLRLLGELHDRARALDEREIALGEHARRLAESQEELRQQLERLCQPSTADASSPGQEELRKSA